MLYFSYGSNMSSKRLQKRVPSAVPFKVAELRNHALKFHKKSCDKSGKCDAEETTNADDIVYGVIYEIDADEMEKLDNAEGVGKGYEKKTVSLSPICGGKLEAITYYATEIDKTLLPFSWYLKHVVNGAREHNLPVDYIRTIEAVESMEDADKSRHRSELSIYC